MVRKKKFEDINDSRGIRFKPSITDPLTLELKELSAHLKYAFLGENLRFPMIMASNLQVDQKEKLLKVPG